MEGREEDSMEYRILSYLTSQGIPRAGLLLENQSVLDIDLALKRSPGGVRASSVLSALENWDSIEPRLKEMADNGARYASASIGLLSEARLAAPILYPGNIYCAAANYLDHSKEMRDIGLPDKRQSRPYFFTKVPRQTVIGHGESIRIPYPEAKVDWEAEIGAVIGRRCKNVEASKAMEYVAGFTIVNDVSDRARNFRPDWHFKFDWLGGKSFDTSAPMGPWITPAELIPDPHNLAIQLRVNEEVMQDASSRDMYFTIPEQIEYLSELFTLLPGDVISTGTPKGVGHARGLYLKPGDSVTITIEGLGTLQNPVVVGFERRKG
jgi:2,4-didehydro-3-deoxy-L-rhamnonate hydrolase